MVMKFSKATPNWVSLWSPSDKSHMNVYSVHPLYKLCFLLKLFLLYSFSAKHCASHHRIIVFSVDRQQFARLRCQWISVERCCTLCKQTCFRNGLLPHPLPQLKSDVCQKKTMSCFSSNMSTPWITMKLTACYHANMVSFQPVTSWQWHTAGLWWSHETVQSFEHKYW